MWISTKLNEFYLLQKWSVLIVFNEGHRSRAVLQKLNVLNILQVNIFGRLNFMHKFYSNQVLNVLYDITNVLYDIYSAKHSLRGL